MAVRGPSDLAVRVGQRFRSARLAIGLSQRELERRTGISQSALSRFERGRSGSIGLSAMEALVAALGGRIDVVLELPFLVDRARQRDSLHARCVGYVARHLMTAGWKVATEVEIQGRFGPGWIDVLAFDPRTRTLLVIEIKTEIHDLGQVQRTLGWYTARAHEAAVNRGWSPRVVRAALLVLATEEADRRIRANEDLITVAFPVRATWLAAWVTTPEASASSDGWGLAMVDPHSRRRAWLIPTRLDGRRRANPYVDYADAARVLAGRSRHRAPRDAPLHQPTAEHARRFGGSRRSGA
jgi:transcriptional regulator with XRE-family HTH domain